MKLTKSMIIAGCALASSLSAQAASVRITATVESLVNENSVTFAPFHVGFHSGVYDPFNIGSEASSALATLAETGSGSAWLPAFQAGDPDSVVGTVGGILTPGQTASSSFVVDTNSNAFFTFAAMVVPSNDFFIGNDSPTEYQILDREGNLLINEIVIGADEVWDAGSEVFNPEAAAFVGDASLRVDQNSVIALQFAEFAAYNGLTTAAGYVFDSQLTANSDIYRVSFTASPVPVPAALPLFLSAVCGLGVVARRRKLAS